MTMLMAPASAAMATTCPVRNSKAWVRATTSSPPHAFGSSVSGGLIM
jgi:hypothetical protein